MKSVLSSRIMGERTCKNSTCCALQKPLVLDSVIRLVNPSCSRKKVKARSSEAASIQQKERPNLRVRWASSTRR
jgi:hypothetical protein